MFDEDFPIGAFAGLGIVLVIFCPWILIPVGTVALAAGVFKLNEWWKIHRFKKIKPAETKIFAKWLGWGIGPNVEGYKLMYLGSDDTMRWWYDYCNCKAVPQAIDDGTVYWEKSVHLKDTVLLKHLNGFYEMGNEWPNYYRNVIAPQEKAEKEKEEAKEKRNEALYRQWKSMTQASPQDILRAQADCINVVPEKKKKKEKAYAKTEPVTILGTDVPLLNLIQTVQDLEKDATGVCPTIDFGSIYS